MNRKTEGDCEYIIDLWELYPEDNARSVAVKPTGSMTMKLYYELPALTILMALLGTTDIAKEREENKLKSWPYRVAVYGIGVIIISFLLRGLYHAWRKKEWSSLFCITPEHPSYTRIQSLRTVEQETIVVPQALLNAIYSAELHEEALKTAPPADSATDMNKPGGEDDLAKTQVSFLAQVDSKEQTPTLTKRSSTESHPTSKGTANSVQQQSREEVNSREKAGKRPPGSRRP
ncbi:hypothetical protein Y032_0011g1419 [Ancylostoma ceylanicum]|uniref:Uncharacterized protein n=1 Tax=Ancylostoma ceylanicum TaxID=53326 RepID=A0A016VFN1_9BILA|nr:hypothetical protein Y032_0011g1419 [Ancylostoma ceylanicum]